MHAETSGMKKDAKDTSEALTGKQTGGGKLGLGSFSTREKVAGAAVIGAGTFMSMAPNTMSAVAQRMYADSVAGLSGMKSQALIKQSNRLVNGATSAGGPTAAAATLAYQGGYSANSLSSRSIMSQLGGLSAITGGTNEQVAGSLAGLNGMTFLRMGVRIRDAQGNLLPINTIVNSTYNALYGGRKITEQQAYLLLNPSSKGYASLMMICGGDQNLFQTIAMAIITRARKGSALTKKDLSSAQQALTTMGVGGDSPLRSNFKYQAGQNAALGATEGGLVSGYNATLNTVGALNQGFAQLASAMGPVTTGLMGLKGILQTMPGAGNMGGTISGIGSMGMGVASQAMNAAIMGRVMGVGRFGGAASTAQNLAKGGIKSRFGNMGMNGKLTGAALLGMLAKMGINQIPGVKNNQGSNLVKYGNMAANMGIGAASGAALGSLIAPGIGTGIGAVLGTGYGLYQSLMGQGGPDDEHGHGIGGDNNMPGAGSTGQATFALPVPKGTRITSPYGQRKGGGGISSNHRGIDFGVRENTNVTAAANGVVTEVGNGGGYGNYVIIKHGAKSTLYAHLNKAMVRVGEQVRSGQVIAKSGGRKGAPGAGASTGPHLHFEVRDNGGRGAQGRVDPQGFFGKAANFISGVFKGGINMAKKALNFVSGGHLFKDVFRNTQNSIGKSPQGLSGLSSPELSSLLSGAISSGSEVGYADIKKYSEGFGKRSVSVGKNITGTINQKDDASAKDGEIAGGSRAGLMKILARAGFSGKALETAFAVVLAESRGRAHDYNGRGRDKSYGLFQINMNNDDPRSPNMGRNRLKQFGIKSNNELFNPDVNAKAGYFVSSHGKSWKQWSTYKDGTFLKYLDDAHRAKEQAGIGGGTDSLGASSIGVATMQKPTPSGKVEVTVHMQVNIARASVNETEHMLKVFNKRLAESIEQKETRVY